MKKSEPPRDPTGIDLAPGHPDRCAGSGTGENEICCDECDYFLMCYPDEMAERI